MLPKFSQEHQEHWKKQKRNLPNKFGLLKGSDQYPCHKQEINDYYQENGSSIKVQLL